MGGSFASESAMRLPMLDELEGVNQVNDIEREIIANCDGESQFDDYQ